MRQVLRAGRGKLQLNRDRCQTLIVGAGIAGLHLANVLEQSGQDYVLIEARDRVGGRIFTEAGHDLGPSWFWPDQPRIQSLLTQHGLEPYPQFQQGDLMYDDGHQIRRIAGQPQQPWYRVTGGLGALTQAMFASLPSDRVLLSAAVRRVRIDGGVHARIDMQSGEHILSCDRVVLTLPPRLLADTVAFEPALPAELIDTLRQVPTWMASHAKAVITYSTAFWRTAGLSGDAFSATGPLGEIHDASTAKEPALFGFFAWDANARAQLDEQTLTDAILSQLVTLFGERAASPGRVYLKNWTEDPLTATGADRPMLNYHPRYGVQNIEWLDRQVLLAGTETSVEYGGFIEGALASAERAARAIIAGRR